MGVNIDRESLYSHEQWVIVYSFGVDLRMYGLISYSFVLVILCEVNPFLTPTLTGSTVQILT